MKQTFILLLSVLQLLGCSHATEEAHTYILHGAWLLQYAEYPSGVEYDYAIDGDGTFCLIYDADSLLYECRMATTPSGLLIMPTAKISVELIDKGGGELMYLEDGDPHPLTISASQQMHGQNTGIPTITIQRKGILYSMTRADNIYQEWGTDICDIIDRDMAARSVSATTNRYVLSAKERQQERTLQWLVIISAFVILAALLAAHLAITNRKAKRQLQLQLRQIQEVQENRPQAVRQVVVTVESEFFASDDYAALHRRIACGQLMKDEDWQQVEHHLKTIYPGFTSQLRSLHPMSELEYQTCLLIKLRIAPKDIAAVLARDTSTISTVRSRLYQKVFGRKGSTKDWDDFILSIRT